jgi:hypothetical protein
VGQLILGPKKEGSGDGAKYSWVPLEKDEETDELKVSLTPGEREVLTEIERKMSKPIFRTTIRGVYVAKRENWKSPNRIILRSYTAHFKTENMNQLAFQGATRPRIHYFWRKRRVFIRARKMFKNAVLRFPPLFPKRMSGDLNPLLSTEEMATLYHFPLRVSGMVSPTMGNIQSKKAGPPPNLPVSE